MLPARQMTTIIFADPDLDCMFVTSATGDKTPKRKFKTCPISRFLIGIAEVQTARGRLRLFVAIDRTGKFVCVERHRAQADPGEASVDQWAEPAPAKAGVEQMQPEQMAVA